MKACDIVEHFLLRADFVNRSDTVDRVIIGNPAHDTDRCLVAWMPDADVLRQMVERGISLLITHEPTFWNHRDEQSAPDVSASEKMQFIMDNRLVIIRIHDCWDRWPEIGIPGAWAKFLGLDSTPVSSGGNGFQHRYDIEPVYLDELASRFAAHCATIGEPMLQVTGGSFQKVSRIGIGTGCACSINTFISMGCDCSVVCDDGTRYWSDIQKAKDISHAVIRVNHGTAEEPGMVTLTGYINDNLPSLHAEHAPRGSTFHLVGSGRLPHST